MADILARLNDAQRARLKEASDQGSILRVYEVLREAASTSDFPMLLAPTLGKILQRAYEQVPDQWRSIVNVATLPDFKEKTILSLSEADDLEEIKGEVGEYKDSTLLESQEKYALGIYGRTFTTTYKTIVNDDMDAIKKQPDRFGRAAARLLNKLVFSILENNPVMGDSTNLFAAGHNNLGTQGLSESSLTTGITAMKKQTDAKGNRIYVRPKYLLVPVELEWTARKLLNSAQVPSAGNDSATYAPNDTNVLKDAGLELLVCDWLTDPNDWYLIADKSTIDTIEVGFLRGVGEAPQLFLKSSGWTTLNGMAADPMGMDDEPIRWKVRHITGAKPVDFRGMYKGQVS
ncbi:Mu-like prophage major head subunit gpT family protein [Heliobacterium chlorum]|uniref:Mu-like prophage major head subunit gpT family protein n=1 Tax=Heliobacterium chlorum TaxID=2698 RepID=A0ABR7SYD0_HELCL|nr:Mu-like prophage major head subunit gpT family protein [Heliobacterium chlorum]MBC9783543.1 Mu-like prophage major head subunit gpT family protein [Heliobacterium chlorum]